jgi:hypothetical protein
LTPTSNHFHHLSQIPWKYPALRAAQLRSSESERGCHSADIMPGDFFISTEQSAPAGFGNLSNGANYREEFENIRLELFFLF